MKKLTDTNTCSDGFFAGIEFYVNTYAAVADPEFAKGGGGPWRACGART